MPPESLCCVHTTWLLANTLNSIIMFMLSVWCEVEYVILQFGQMQLQFYCISQVLFLVLIDLFNTTSSICPWNKMLGISQYEILKSLLAVCTHPTNNTTFFYSQIQKYWSYVLNLEHEKQFFNNTKPLLRTQKCQENDIQLKNIYHSKKDSLHSDANDMKINQ